MQEPRFAYPAVKVSFGQNKRMEIRNMLDGLFRKNSKVRGNIYHAMSNVNLEYLPPGIPARGKRGPAPGHDE